MPSVEHVRKALASIKVPADFAYFFDQLKSPDWIRPLWEARMFSRPYPPIVEGESVSFPPWPASRYLVRVASQAPEVVEGIIQKIPETKNVRIHEDYLEAALRMPPDIAARLVPRAISWFASPYKFILPEKLGALLSHIARGGQKEPALKLAKALLAVRTDIEREDSGDKNYHLPPEPAALFDEWTYNEILKEYVPDLVACAWIDALVLLCDQLEVAIKISLRAPEEQDFEDFSYVWRSAIEENEQNLSHGIKSLLVSAVRDAAQQIVSSSSSQIRTVTEKLESRGWKIFRRLALHIMRLFPETMVDLITARLTDQNLWDDLGVHHEYSLLLRDCFPRIDSSAQQQILNWIESGPPDLETRVAAWTQGSGQVPSEEEIQNHRKSWQLKKLALISESLPQPWKVRYQSLVSELGEPSHPEFTAYSTGVHVGPASPKTVDELSTMPVDELRAYLEEWHPQKDPFSFAPSPEGLGRQLAELVARSPDRYAQYASKFCGLDPTYVRSFLQGFNNALGQNKSYAWKPVLELCRWVVNQPRSIPGRMVDRWDADPDWGWTRKVIAGLIGAGFQNDAIAIPFKDRELIWDMLKILAEDPDPGPEDETEVDPSHLSINTTRGEALHTVMRYAIWVCNHLDRQKKQRIRSFSRMPEVQSLLDAHLDTSRDFSLAIRSIYGQWFPSLVWLDKMWAIGSSGKIFPHSESLRKFHDAAWGTYITFCRPFNEVLDVLRDEYALAIERIGTPAVVKTTLADPDERIAEHLMAFYGFGKLSLKNSESFIVKFFLKASDRLCGHALQSIGRNLHATKSHVEPRVIERFKALWKWRMQEVLKPPGPTVHSEELAAFGWWFGSQKFDDRWALAQLSEVLKHIGKPKPDFLVVEQLAKLSPVEPEQTVKCLRKIVEGDERGYLILSHKEDIRKILDAAIHSGDAQAHRAALRLVNDLAVRGFDEFGELIR